MINTGDEAPDFRLKAYVKSLFMQYDEDHSGTISAREFRKLCIELGYFFTVREQNEIFAMCDVNRNGEVEFGPFWKFWKTSKKFRISDPAKLKLCRAALEQFRRYDTDGSGRITLSDYKKISEASGWHTTDAQLQQMIANIDKSNKGEIGFEDFVVWLNWGL